MPETISLELFSEEDLLKGISSIEKSLPGLPASALRAAADDISRMAVDVVNIKVEDVLASGWKAYGELKKYTDRRQYPPDRVSRLALASHHITSTHKPRIKVLLNEKEIGSIDFEVKLDFEIEGAMLVIQAGRLTGVDGARVQATGTLACEGVNISTSSSKKITLLSNGLSFDPGIPIDGTV